MANVAFLDRLKAYFATRHAAMTTRRFSRAVHCADETQGKLLLDMLAAGALSDFGRDHHFGRIRSYSDYVANVPIRTYAEASPYIDKVRSGHAAALFAPGTPILMFALTSGTTAQPKYIPITRRALADCRAGWNIWGLKSLLDHRQCLLRHIVQVTSPMNDHLSASGVPCGAITGLLAATQKKLVRRYYTSPLAVAGIADSTAKYYAIMRLAIPKDVAWMVTANPSTLLTLARLADQHRDQMIRDIHDGTLTQELPVEAPIRDALAPLLKPDTACAKRLEEIVRRRGAMFPKDYWRLGFLAHWTGGTMGLYRSLFPKYFGDIPARDIGLIASEGRISIPMQDETAAGVLAVTSQYFEFIPAEEYAGEACGTGVSPVLRCHELREGGEYFIVLTNFSGLYRYDMGDRVRVVGWQGRAPVIEFLSRDAHTSSMAGEKLTENQVVLAMRQACQGGPAITDFVVSPRWAETPWYRLYVAGGQMRADLAQRFDAALCAVSVEYDSKRKTLRLAAVEVVTIPEERLAERDRLLRARRSRSSEQFKHQYLLPRPGMDTDLEALLRT